MYTAPPKLSNIHILLADGDLHLSGMLYHMLHTMGFAQVTRVGSGHKALELIEKKSVDILITEWSMEGKDGLELVSYLRDPQKSPNLTMPIIMMTGRAERMNVEQARDYGVTEFLVKPVTTAMLFDRIRRVFDMPRDFVIAQSYVGPDRRHGKAEAKSASSDKRSAKPLMVSKTSLALNNDARPVIVSKNFDLRNKARLSDTISTVITPELLGKADAVIASYSDESTQWIRDDLNALERNIELITLPTSRQKAEKIALSIKSRAGTFGYDMASSVAFALYVFLYHDCDGRHPSHMVILRKHIDVLKVLLTSDAIGANQQMEEALVEGLLAMTAKLKTTNQKEKEHIAS